MLPTDLVYRLSGDWYYNGNPERVSRIDILDNIRSNSNQNVLICGSSGSGKSELMNYLLEIWNGVRVVFSFKPDDASLRLPIRVIDVAQNMPNPFKDKEAFVEAYGVAFPVDSVGIMASQISSLLRSALYEPNVSDFPSLVAFVESKVKEKESKIQSDVWASILANLDTIRVSVSGFYFDIKDTVFDFSGLNDDAKTFYAEYFLRQIWKTITSSNQDKVVLAVDEIHRLARVKHSIVWRSIMREIRHFGAIWSATQNYSDISESLSNQYDNVFLFRTVNSEDLGALSKMDRVYTSLVCDLPAHSFIMPKALFSDRSSLPAYRLDLTPVLN